MPTMESLQAEIAAMLDVADEELTEEQRAAMDHYLNELGQAEADKVDAFASFIREESSRAKFYREESQRLASKARTAEGRIAFIKDKYLNIMRQNGVEKIKGNAYALSIRHTPTVAVDDADSLDDLYVRVIPAKREPDKRTILEALKGGVEIPGCKIVQSDSLMIR